MTRPALGIATALLCAAGSVHGATEDVPIGFLPGNWVSASLAKTLGAKGRFVLLSPDGPVRIVAAPEEIASARAALLRLQTSPAMVALEMSFVAFTDKTEARPSAPPPPEVIDGIPAPRHFTPPRIVATPGGGAIAVPSQPIFSRRAAAAPAAGAGEGIPVTRQSSRILRRVNASCVLGQSVSVPLTRLADPAGLRGLALKLDALPAAAPDWSSASTELQVQTELRDGVLAVTVTPQMVVPGRADGKARRIPFTACSAGIPISRGAPAPVGTLPRTDAEFYRLMIGTAPTEPGAVMALRVSATVHYAGSPPP